MAVMDDLPPCERQLTVGASMWLYIRVFEDVRNAVEDMKMEGSTHGSEYVSPGAPSL